MENKSHALAAGAFVLLVSALLLAMTFWLTRDTREQVLYELSTANAVTGLQPKAAVRFKGVEVGKVVAVRFDPQASGRVLIRIAIDRQAPVTRATFGTLGFQGVTGLAYVALDDEGSSAELLTASDDGPARIPMRQSPLARLSDQGGKLLTQLEELSQRVNQLLGADNQQQVMGAVGSLARAAGSIDRLASRTERVLGAQLGPDLRLPQLSQEASTSLRALQSSAERIGESAQEARELARSLRQVAERLDAKGGVLDRLGQGVDQLSASNQALQANTLPRVNRAADEATRSARAIGQTAGALAEQPQALIFGTSAPLPGPGEPGFATRLPKP
jgi:phospholipid/cholesterol/gamma-HCH transport system substrate-binding protein